MTQRFDFSNIFNEVARKIDTAGPVCYSIRRLWGRGVVGLTRGPVKAEIAGSKPVAPAEATFSVVKVAFFVIQD